MILSFLWQSGRPQPNASNSRAIPDAGCENQPVLIITDLGESISTANLVQWNLMRSKGAKVQNNPTRRTNHECGTSGQANLRDIVPLRRAPLSVTHDRKFITTSRYHFFYETS